MKTNNYRAFLVPTENKIEIDTSGDIVNFDKFMRISQEVELDGFQFERVEPDTYGQFSCELGTHTVRGIPVYKGEASKISFRTRLPETDEDIALQHFLSGNYDLYLLINEKLVFVCKKIVCNSWGYTSQIGDTLWFESPKFLSVAIADFRPTYIAGKEYGKEIFFCTGPYPIKEKSKIHVMTLAVAKTHKGNENCKMRLAQNPKGNWYCIDCGLEMLWENVEAEID